MTTNLTRRLALLIGLATLMVATRMSHFGTHALLPDASLAVFLLGGLLLQRLRGFAVLMLLAFATDVLSAKTAIQVGWCLTPAYWGMIPTYGLLWMSGRWLGKRQALEFTTAAGVSLAAITGAFIISNAFWYAWSTTISGLDVYGYSAAVAKYFPPYLGSAMVYLVPVWLGWKLMQVDAGRKAERI
jgi:hypothetical protein